MTNGKPIPSGPPGHWLLGNLPDYRRDRLELFMRCAREYGECVGLRLGTRSVALLSHPELISQVLVKQNKKFRKSPLLRRNRRVFGKGLLTAEKDEWLSPRKIMQPEFLPARVETFAPMMVSYAARTADSWNDGETRDLHADMMRLALEVVSKALFDADVSADIDEIAEATTIVLEGMVARLNGLFVIPEWVPTPVNLRIGRAVDRLERIVYGILRDRRGREDGGEHIDVLSRLRRARDEHGRPLMSPRQLRDQVLSLLIAGHETTANALTWCWYLLSHHQDAQDRLHAELDSVLCGRDPTAADLPRLEFTERIVTEVLRLYPPAYVIGRQALESCSIGPYRVPAGTIILISQWAMHRNPAYFDRPDEFLPDRWRSDELRHTCDHVFLPFGGGPRVCIGSNFAMTEAILILATIARRFALLPVKEHQTTPSPSLTLRPKTGLLATLRCRRI